MDPRFRHRRTGERILCAAVLFRTGTTYEGVQAVNMQAGVLVCGHRHCNCFASARAAGIQERQHAQGFLTSRNRFVDRHEAARIAWRAGQCKERLYDVHKKRWAPLYSEDLY